MSLQAIIGGRDEIFESKEYYDSESNPKGGNHIIDVEPNAIVATSKIQPSKQEEQEEGEHLFHSHIWVNGAMLHFIVDSGS
jgi:hypothetical protein